MILVVVAHPDDESFSMGGTIAQMVQGGCSVTVATLADGTGSRRGPTTNAGKRRGHFYQSCKVLDVDPLPLDVFPDQRSDTVPQLEINREVEKLVVQYQPSLVYTHHVGDLNLDHRRTAEAVLVATRGVCPVFCMSPEWPKRSLTPWAPTIERNIWDVLDVKVKACLAYQDEIREYPHPRSERAIREQPIERFMEIQ